TAGGDLAGLAGLAGESAADLGLATPPTTPTTTAANHLRERLRQRFHRRLRRARQETPGIRDIRRTPPGGRAHSPADRAFRRAQPDARAKTPASREISAEFAGPGSPSEGLRSPSRGRGLPGGVHQAGDRVRRAAPAASARDIRRAAALRFPMPSPPARRSRRR